MTITIVMIIHHSYDIHYKINAKVVNTYVNLKSSVVYQSLKSVIILTLSILYLYRVSVLEHYLRETNLSLFQYPS